MAQATYTVEIDLRPCAQAISETTALLKRAVALHKRVGGRVPPGIKQFRLVGCGKAGAAVAILALRNVDRTHFELSPTRHAEFFTSELEAWIQRLQAAARRQ